MRIRPLRYSLPLFLFLSLFGVTVRAAAPELAAAFRDPPPAAHPWVFWYWMSASSSREGITADLEAMKAVGLAGAHLVPIKGAAHPSLFEPTAEQFSPRWWDHVTFAIQEADRLGLRLAFHASDGYATAGGPWIQPEQSMQKVVWSSVVLDGGRRAAVDLPQPETNEGYYRDLRVVAFPAWADADVTTRTRAVTVTTSNAGQAPQFLPATAGGVFTSEQPCWIQYAFAEPFTCRSLTVRVPPTKGIQNAVYHANRLEIEASDDGRTFRPVTRLRPPRHGWQDGDGDATHAIPAVTARYFRFRYDPAGAEAGAEDLDAAKWKPVLKLRGLELSSEPRLDQFEGKSGRSWRISPRTTADQVPSDLCVPLKNCIDLTARVSASGHLDWDAPVGRWIVLRLGHTSTGYRNDTAGAQMGLECDKFDPAAARLMFDRWFEEIRRHAGPDRAGRVMKVLHVDSWECGTQNWSRVFADEFARRRSYDPLPYLPAMAGIPVESVDVSERFLRDVRETIAELITDNFFKPLRELAHAQGCTLSAESVAPVGLSDNLQVFSEVDTPMGEFWLRSPTHDKLNDVLDSVSGARIYGRRVVQAEAFTELRMQWDEAPALLKPLGDRNLALGVNREVYHVFTHNPWLDRKPGMTLGGTGHYFQRDQTWWRPGAAWIRYVERCQALLQEGQPVVDVAVFIGDSAPRRALVPWHLATTLPGFFPQPDPRLARKIIEADDWPDPLGGYTYDSINRDALLRLAQVKDGRIVLPGGASYALLVLPADNPAMPDAGRLTPELLVRVRDLVESGATVLISQRPQGPAGLSGGTGAEETFRQAAAFLWPEGTVRGTVRQVGRGRIVHGPFRGGSFAPLGLARDVSSARGDEPPGAGVAWTHRATSDAEIYFVSNQQGVSRDLALSFRTTGRVPELWDAVTGEMRPAGHWSTEGARTTLPLRLPPGGSVFVVFREPTSDRSVSRGRNWLETTVAQTVDSPWRVQFDPAQGGPSKAKEFPRLQSWTENDQPGVRNYSGTASYTASVSWKPADAAGSRVWLDLGEVAELAEVSVNGVPCGVAWTPPYRVEITPALRAGTNQLRVDVTNTWFNRLAGDRDLPEAQRLTHTTAPDRTAGKPLLRAGLLGPVTLQVEKQVPQTAP